MRIKELMTPDPVVVPPDMRVEALVRLLADRHLSGVFVVDAAGAPLGVVTEADLVRRLAPQDEEGLVEVLRRGGCNRGASGRSGIGSDGSRCAADPIAC